MALQKALGNSLPPAFFWLVGLIRIEYKLMGEQKRWAVAKKKGERRVSGGWVDVKSGTSWVSFLQFYFLLKCQ